MEDQSSRAEHETSPDMQVSLTREEPMVDNATLVELGKRLKERRLTLGKHAKEVAAAANITPTYLWMLEAAINPKTGRPPRPSPDVLGRLANSLQLNDQEFQKLLHLAGHISNKGPDHGQEEPPLDVALLPYPEVFVDRRNDLLWLTDRLRQNAKGTIVALSGMAGVGKTALAAEALRTLRNESLLRDGVIVLFYHDVRDGDSAALLQHIFTRLMPQGQHLTGTTLGDIAIAGQRLVGSKRPLVVLDGVDLDSNRIAFDERQKEGSVDETPTRRLERVVTVLRNSGVALLLTGRQVFPRTVIPGEASRVLGPLPDSAALELFARSYGHDNFDGFSERDAVAVRHIVAQLGGHPGAIRLTSTYAADMGRDLARIAQEFEDPYHTLKFVSNIDKSESLWTSISASLADVPDAPDVSIEADRTRRHLHYTRRLLEALSAIAADEFSRGVAVAVATAMGDPRPQPSLDELVGRCLLSAFVNLDMSQKSDRERLRLTPLIRGLAQSGFNEPTGWTEEERRVVRRAIAEYYASYVESVGDVDKGFDEENITRALEWVHSQSDDRLTMRLCWGMRQYWSDRWLTVDGLRYLPWGLAAAEVTARQTGARSDLLYEADLALSYGRMLQRTGQLEEAVRVFELNRNIRQQAQDNSGEALVLYYLGKLALDRRQLDVAAKHFQDALAIHRRTGDRKEEGAALGNLGRVAFAQGRLREAENFFLQSRAIACEIQDRRGEGRVLGLLGQVAQWRGQLEEARYQFERARQLAEEVDDLRAQSVALTSLGNLALNLEQLDEAERFTITALDIDWRVQDRRGEAIDLVQLGRIAFARGLMDDAEGFFLQARAIAEEVGDRRNLGVAISQLGLLERERDNLELAEGYFQDALKIAREVRNRRAEGVNLSHLGWLAQEQGRLDEAQHYLEEALAIAREVESRQDESACLTLWGRLAIEQGRLDEAQHDFEEALAIDVELQDRRGESIDCIDLGWLAQEQERLDEAQHYLEEALAIAREMGDRGDMSVCLTALGQLAEEQERLDEAQHCFEEALAIAREMGDKSREASAIAEFGWLAHRRHQFDEAQRYFEEALAIAVDQQDEDSQATFLTHLGALARDRGQDDMAEHYYQRARRLGHVEAGTITFHNGSSSSDGTGQYSGQQMSSEQQTGLPWREQVLRRDRPFGLPISSSLTMIADTEPDALLEAGEQVLPTLQRYGVRILNIWPIPSGTVNVAFDNSTWEVSPLDASPEERVDRSIRNVPREVWLRIKAIQASGEVTFARWLWAEASLANPDAGFERKRAAIIGVLPSRPHVNRGIWCLFGTFQPVGAPVPVLDVQIGGTTIGAN